MTVLIQYGTICAPWWLILPARLIFSTDDNLKSCAGSWLIPHLFWRIHLFLYYLFLLPGLLLLASTALWWLFLFWPVRWPLLPLWYLFGIDRWRLRYSWYCCDSDGTMTRYTAWRYDPDTCYLCYYCVGDTVLKYLVSDDYLFFRKYYLLMTTMCGWRYSIRLIRYCGISDSYVIIDVVLFDTSGLEVRDTV